MMQTLNVPYPTEPKAGWTRGVAIEGEPIDEAIVDLGENTIEEPVLSTDDGLSDEELYPSDLSFS
jgi:hypothetical protein